MRPALGVRSLAAPEAPPPQRPPGPTARRAEIVDGWRYVLSHPGLRALFFNSQVFGAGLMAAVPLLAVFLLRDLHFPAGQYGLALGLPGVGGVLGALALRSPAGAAGQWRRPGALGEPVRDRAGLLVCGLIVAASGLLLP